MSTNKRKSYTSFIFASELLFIRVKNTQHNVMCLISIRNGSEGHCSSSPPNTDPASVSHLFFLKGKLN